MIFSCAMEALMYYFYNNKVLLSFLLKYFFIWFFSFIPENKLLLNLKTNKVKPLIKILKNVFFNTFKNILEEVMNVNSEADAAEKIPWLSRFFEYVSEIFDRFFWF